VKRFALFLVLFATTVQPLAASSTEAGNPWLTRRVLNIAHQGGEIEAPSNTLFAFKTAVAKGSEMLELDVHATSDGHLVVLHDATVDRTTDGTGSIDEMTLAEIKELDAAYWFVPDCGTCHGKADDAYTYRGLATSVAPMPKGFKKFEPNDFKIPTLEEVLEEFPDRFINIEIKETAPNTVPYEDKLAAVLARYGRASDVIVVSFLDHAIERFKIHAPDVHTATATGETGLFWATARGPGAPNPRYQALQVPLDFEGLEVVNEDFVAKAHANGLAVHVWTINDRPTMEWLIDIGVDGIMSDRPALLERVLREAHVRY
jgi:glycerophosphoryl diester phosphodiesterase